MFFLTSFWNNFSFFKLTFYLGCQLSKHALTMHKCECAHCYIWIKKKISFKVLKQTQTWLVALLCEFKMYCNIICIMDNLVE